MKTARYLGGWADNKSSPAQAYVAANGAIQGGVSHEEEQVATHLAIADETSCEADDSAIYGCRGVNFHVGGEGRQAFGRCVLESQSIAEAADVAINGSVYADHVAECDYVAGDVSVHSDILAEGDQVAVHRAIDAHTFVRPRSGHCQRSRRRAR